jgi:glutamyl-tRNA reductase
MDISVIGLNHKTAPIELRERLAVSNTRLPQVLQLLRGQAGLTECVLLSTCNRTEVYTIALADVERLIEPELAGMAGLEACELRRHLYSYRNADAVKHLFRVACGIDSMIVGENQVLGQVKRAYEIASDSDSVGGLLSKLFETALCVGKRVHTETSINRNDASVASAAVDLARKALGSLKERRVLLLGAGEVSTLTAKRLMECGARGIIVANRTHQRAREIAEQFQGRAARYEDLERELVDSDILIASSSAPRFMLKRAQLEKIMLEREMRPLVLIDIAVPRDIEPSAADIGGVTLYDIDDLNQIVMNANAQRNDDIIKAERIISQATDDFAIWQSTLPAVPVIRGLRGLLERIAVDELQRHEKNLATLDQTQMRAVQMLIRSIINKIAHPSISHLKDYASAGDIERLQTVARMFGIDDNELHGEWREIGTPTDDCANRKSIAGGRAQ